jgi:penicillin amidase
MRLLAVLFSALLCAGLIRTLDRPLGDSPTLGRLLDPFSGIWANQPPSARDAGIAPGAIPGLSGPASVRYDSSGVPHIFASSLEDAVRIQGYLTARDRLWQMEFQTHAAAGRLAGILGPDLDEPGDGKLLRYDRLQRRLGMGYAAEQALEAINRDETTRTLLQAYADGVNAWIASLQPRDYPVEYKLLGYAPEPWEPLKTALLIKSMGQDLSSTEYDLQYTQLLRLLGRSVMDDLYPDQGGNTEPIAPRGTPWNFTPLDLDTPGAYEPPALALREALPPLPEKNLGSNNWAVSGSRTASGYPILCNDPHLQLNLPSIWYQVQLVAEGVNVCGVSLPGAPGVVIGFNRDMAWGVTNAGRDVRDWYRITFHESEPGRYQYDGGWRQAKPRVETIRVKGSEAIIDTVWYTHHGPVVYDRSFGHRELEGYALRWELHQPSNEMRTFFALNTASALEDYLAALPHFQCPGQNLLYADRKGDIAITQQGRFPARWPGQGRFLLDGSRPDHEWQAYIPLEHLTQTINPQRGYVSSANQYPADSDYPYYQLGNFEAYRNRRLNDLLDSAGNGITVQDMMAIQLDNYGQMASEVLPLLLELVPQARAELGSWDYNYDAESAEAGRFQRWYDTLFALTWDELEQPGLSLTLPENHATIALMHRDPQSPWFDLRSTAQVEDLSALASSAWDRSEGSAAPTWWQTKSTSIMHLLKLEPFSEQGVACGGNRNILNATSERHGPSWRMVVELSDPPRAWGIYPGGQSGNPLDPAYTDQVADWARGAYRELLFLQSETDRPQSTAYTLKFTP